MNDNNQLFCLIKYYRLTVFRKSLFLPMFQRIWTETLHDRNCCAEKSLKFFDKSGDQKGLFENNLPVKFIVLYHK